MFVPFNFKGVRHMTNNTAVVEGIDMRWEEHGDGLPLVLIHGIPTSPALWRHVLPLISGARCLAFEMVGYGESIPQGNGRDISIARQADYVAAWLKHLGIEQAAFAGHDLGGGVVQHMVARYPNLCRGIFLTNAIGYDSWPIPSVKMLRAMALMARQFPDVMVKQIIRSMMIRGHDNMARAREATDIHWQPYKRHGAAEALTRQIQALKVEDTLAVEQQLQNSGVRARIAWGAADQFQKIGYGERFAQDLKAPLYRIENGKHFTPEDHPEIVAREINQLLADVQ
jgi:pimeloyl-ACP methyl ester carboxylesterase